MIFGAVIVFCILILILAFLFPRLSQRPQSGGQRVMSVGSRGASKAPGKAGRWLSKPFQSGSRAIGRSGATGRRARAKID